MADFSSIDPTSLAQSLASYDIMAIQNQLKTKTATMTSQKKALDALRTALTDFRSAIKGLNNTNDGMLKNVATLNREGIANVTANSAAQKGTYNIEVDQLASAHQIGFGDLTDESIKNATGTMDITLGEGADAKTITVDMDSVSSLSDLTKAINGNEDNPGVTASLIRTDGKVTLMLSSDESGAANKVTVGGTSGFDSANAKEISKAADAKFRMGEMEFTNSSNTLDKLIEGVTIELTSKTEADKPLTITIGTDTTGTKEQLQTFIDSYNTLQDTLQKLTKSGSGDGEERGAFAGDSTMASLDRELNDVLRTVFGGKRMSDFGITADKDGKLEIDSKKLDTALTADPQALTGLFNGKEGLISKMDKSLDRYLNSNTGLLKGRQDVLDRQQSDIDTKTDAMNTRYDSSYNRYLKQFTQLQQAMSQMNNTMSMFGLA
ncbi:MULTISPECIES: flagellar filament capping protein FliD [Lelliottia]|jgi:flagellar hook-associated protein 2|uniref:Flagellar hook-associated protein 2 n=1 Tax=Lelliottia aquatilis TaxID=2080838 RepID=A0ABX4ZZ00_9ENTR|nr:MULTISPECIES: flagellar filament capping protein FliD [Lelliottia]ASV53675.1 Flagellar hook-associated protein FliD [Lelliottia jeotgali]MBL5885787.1 flagellar filament capping protein FliD [Lelliottia aquatilis]NTZ47554.1 flagellar hook-associated protein [Lelliottia aquatilis]POZ16605.1 flagellar hook-associated protein [Lelliottia sp. 7254-16]POZ20779.1 flagellar hook-associated protein [Lelliottia aquatilis]